MLRAPLLSPILILIFSLAIAAQKQDDPQAVRSVESMPISYGIVVDNSGSYRLLFDRIIKTVTEIVESQKEGDEGFLVTFVDTKKINLRQDFTNAKSDLLDAAENMFIEGGHTAILDAVELSAKHLAENANKDSNRRRALILITDGDERQSLTTLEIAIKTLKDAEIKVYVIGMSDEKIYPKLLDRLTKETGGVKYLPKTRDEIANAVKSLSIAIRSK